MFDWVLNALMSFLILLVVINEKKLPTFAQEDLLQMNDITSEKQRK